MAKRRISLGGKDFEAEEVGFQPDAENGGEQWSNYTLHDGTSMKVKSVVVQVMRVEGAFGPNGDPIYNVNASLVVSTTSPESLRKK